MTLIRSGHYIRYDMQTEKAILVFGKHQNTISPAQKQVFLS